MSPRRIAVTSILVALASVLHAIEALLPLPYIVPGAKLGLANAVSLYSVATMGLYPALGISLLRTLLGSVLSGTFLSTGYYLSTSGAIVSTLVMYLVLKVSHGKLSVVGASVVGSFAHNCTQLLVASVLLNQAGVMFYLPYLLMFAIPTGVFVGIFTARVIRAYPAAGIGRR